MIKNTNTLKKQTKKQKQAKKTSKTQYKTK